MAAAVLGLGMTVTIAVGVLALQGAFQEHLKLLQVAAKDLVHDAQITWKFLEVRTPGELASCDALIMPGGESTTMSLVAARSGLLEPLRDYVKVQRKPTWGTCAGLILLAESANRTKKGGQDLIGGLDVEVHRNYFGRQIESFEADMILPFLNNTSSIGENRPYHGVFIRAPVVEKLLTLASGEREGEVQPGQNVVAPARDQGKPQGSVEVMARLSGRSRALKEKLASTNSDEKSAAAGLEDEVGDIVAVRQENVFGTSFHPELTGDARIHTWWLEQVARIVASHQ